MFHAATANGMRAALSRFSRIYAPYPKSLFWAAVMGRQRKLHQTPNQDLTTIAREWIKNAPKRVNLSRIEVDQPHRKVGKKRLRSWRKRRRQLLADGVETTIVASVVCRRTLDQAQQASIEDRAVVPHVQGPRRCFGPGNRRRSHRSAPWQRARLLVRCAAIALQDMPRQGKTA